MPIYDTGPFYNDYANFKIAYVGINVTNLSPLSSAQIQIVIYNFSSLSGSSKENYPLPNYSPTASPLSLAPYTSTGTNNSAYQLIGINTPGFGVVGVRLYVTGNDADQVIPCVTFLDSNVNVLRVCSAGDLSSVSLPTLTTAYVAASNTINTYAFDVTTPSQKATSIDLNTNNSRAITGNDTTVFVGGGGDPSKNISIYPIYAATNTVGTPISITAASTSRQTALLNISPDGSTVFGSGMVESEDYFFYLFKFNTLTKTSNITDSKKVANFSVPSQLAVANSSVLNNGSLLPSAYIVFNSTASGGGEYLYISSNFDIGLLSGEPHSGVTAPVDSSIVYAVPANTSSNTSTSSFNLYLIYPYYNLPATIKTNTSSLTPNLVSGRAAVDPTNNNIVYILYNPLTSTSPTAPQVLKVTVTPGAPPTATPFSISFNTNFVPNGTTFTAIATSKEKNAAYITYIAPTSISDGIVAFDLTNPNSKTYYTEGFADVDVRDIFIYNRS